MPKFILDINICVVALVVQEVFPDTGQVQVTLTDDSYISLPEEIFRNSNEPGLVNTVQPYTSMHTYT